MRRASARPPEISVVIPTYERPRELESCLAGYAEQTAARHRYEVIVVDDGSKADLRRVVRAFARRLRLRYVKRPHAGAAAARNAALALASAPLIVLGEDDVRPLPSLIAYCLDFHAQHPAEGDAVLLHFTLHPALRTSALLYYLAEHRSLLHPFPPRSGIYGWPRFWGGAVSCKRSLFGRGLFDPTLARYEDTELGLRLSLRGELKIHFEPFAQAVMTRPLTMAQVASREYAAEYHRRLLLRRAGRSPGILAALGGQDPLAPPESAVDEPTLRGLLEGIGQVEATLAGVDPRFAPGAGPRLALLFRLYDTVVAHARARGWRDADLGRPPSFAAPPASAPAFLAAGAPRAPAAGPASEDALDEAARGELRRVLVDAELRLGRAPSVLDWHTGLELAAHLRDHVVAAPPGSEDTLPYLDRTFDVVVAPAGSNRAGEARRVAAAAVVTLTPRARRGPRLSCRWMCPRPAVPPASIVVDAGRARGRGPRLRALRATLPAAGEELLVARVKRGEAEAGARNRAAAGARSDVLVFVRDGMRLHEGWLLPLLRLLRDDPEAAVAAPGARAPAADGGPRRPVPWAAPGVLAVRRALFVAAGGFTVAPPPQAERELCRRLHAYGHRVFEEPRSAAAIGP